MQDWGLVPHHMISLVGGYMENGESLVVLHNR